MAIKFALRGTSLDAHISYDGASPGVARASGDTDPTSTTYADSSVFGNKAIDLSAGGDARKLVYPGFKNFSQNAAWSIVFRFVPNFTGAPSSNLCLFAIGPNGTLDTGGSTPKMFLLLATNNLFYIQMSGAKGESYLGAQFIDDGTYSPVSGVAVEICLSWNGTSGGGNFKFSRNGVQKNTLSPGASWSADNYKWITSFIFGHVAGFQSPGGSNFAINEFLVYDTNINHVYTARTAFDSTAAFNYETNSDPGIANVVTGTNYIINGSTLTGTYSPLSQFTNPGIANVRLNTSYLYNGSTLTGTLDLPAASDVRSGVLFDNSSQTGSLVAITPTTYNNQIDLDAIKDNVQSILSDANTTTASLDLSGNLGTRRVKKLLKVNPGRIPLQASWYPYVTCFIEQKQSVESASLQSTIGRSPANAKRSADIVIKVVGCVWNENAINKDEDPADNHCEFLMEAVEGVLRNNPTLNGKVTWSRVDSVTYHNAPLREEKAHLRYGFLTLNGRVYY